MHLLFNQWWSQAPDDVKAQYVEILLGDPVYKAWYEAGDYCDAVDINASGARLALTALRQLERSGGRYALVTMCIGLGQGIAVVLERSSQD